MGFLKHVFDFYLNASIHVAFGVFSLTQITYEIFVLESDGHLAWFLFFGTIACYNFIKYGVEADKYLVVANSYQKNIQVVSFLAVLLACYHAYFLHAKVWLGIAALVFLTGLYAIPVLPNAKNLRNLGGLKIFIVALVWAGATVILPTLGSFHSISWDIWIETIQRFLFVLVLLIPFEIRDLKYDSVALRTIPQRFGAIVTQWLGVVLSALFFCFAFLKDDIAKEEILVNGFLLVLLVVMVILSGKTQSKYFASFWVESVPMFWYCMLVVSLKWF